MPIQLEFEEHPDYLYVRFTGPGQVQELDGLFATIIGRCRQLQLRKCVCDITGVQIVLSTTERYLMGRSTGAFGQAGIKVAAVARADWIDPKRFGELVAQNAGARLQVFTEVSVALAWLLAE